MHILDHPALEQVEGAQRTRGRARRGFGISGGPPEVQGIESRAAKHDRVTVLKTFGLFALALLVSLLDALELVLPLVDDRGFRREVLRWHAR